MCQRYTGVMRGTGPRWQGSSYACIASRHRRSTVQDTSMLTPARVLEACAPCQDRGGRFSSGLAVRASQRALVPCPQPQPPDAHEAALSAAAGGLHACVTVYHSTSGPSVCLAATSCWWWRRGRAHRRSPSCLVKRECVSAKGAFDFCASRESTSVSDRAASTQARHVFPTPC